MKKWFLSGVILVLVWSVNGSDWKVQGEGARAELLSGVEVIDTSGLPGPILCLSENAFPVVAGKNNDGTLHPICAGSFYGKGRVLALGHPGFLVARPYRADTERFLRNALGWLGAGDGRSLAVWENESCGEAMRELGYEVEVVKTVEAATKHAVIVYCVNKNALEEIPAILEYVREGGSVFYTTLAWGWKWYVSQSGGAMSLSQNFDDEHFLAPVGLLSCDRGMGGTTADKGFSTATELPYGSGLPEALVAVRDPVQMANDTIRKQVAKTLMQVTDAYPPMEESPVFRELLSLSRLPEAQKTPSPKEPLTEADFLARVATIMRKNAWQADPVKLWPADPAASVYPGLPAADAERLVGMEQKVDLAERRWHSTGLFAGAGEPIMVEVPEGVETLGLRLRVGTTSDDITAAQNHFVRAPLVTVSIPLDARKVTFSTPFGGLLYVDVPESIATKSGEANVTISGAVKAPWFRLGRDKPEDFLRDLQAAKAPQLEIEGERFVVTAQCANNRDLTNPAWLAEVWDRVVELDEGLTALPSSRPYKQRLCYDEQLTSGLLHDGYPMMAYINHEAVDEVLNEERLRKEGAWGVLHEMGHNHQNGDWTFAGTTEVTVNIFTLYTSEKVLGIGVRDAKTETRVEDAKRRVLRWVEEDKSFDVWKGDPFLGLEAFTRLREAFGWELFERLFREYREPVVGERPRNDDEKRDQWATRLSRIYGANFAEYFGAWSIPLSEAAVAECAAYPSLRGEHPELFRWLELPTYEAEIPVTVTPRDGAIENPGNYAVFKINAEAEVYNRALYTGIRSGTFELEVEITDETTGEKARFVYPIADMNKDARDTTLQIASGRFGLTPQAEHAYTVELWAREGEALRYHGVSAKGAFVSSDTRFLGDGANAFEFHVKRLEKPSVLTGKNILFVGDSITEAICEVNSAELHYTAGWPGRIGWKHGMRWVNAGISGARLTNVWGPGNTIRNQLKWNEADPFDFLILHGGINDAMGRAPVGVVTPGATDAYNPEAETFETFAGSLEYTFWLAQKLYPNAIKGYIINFKVAPSGWSDWEMFPKYIPVAKEICAKWGIPYIDLWDNESVTAQMRPETCTAMGDSLHPNDHGYDVLAPYIEQFVLALAEGNVAPGTEFMPKPTLAMIHRAAFPALDDPRNVAAGKPALGPHGHSIVRALTDGNVLEKFRLSNRSTRFEDLERSTCYVDIDLQALYTIDSIRVFSKPVNAVAYWAAYASPDQENWTLIANQSRPRMCTDEGTLLSFPPLDAKYVRFYGYTKTAPYRQECSEVQVFGTLSPANQEPITPVEITESDTNLALGCPMMSGADVHPRKYLINDGRTLGATLGLGPWRESDSCFAELDLQKLCSIHKLRASFHDNDSLRWVALACDDRTRPLNEWTQLGGKNSLTTGAEDTAIAFPPTRARFVRLYGTFSALPELTLTELEVFGSALEEDAPAPRHTLDPSWAHDETTHYHPCTDADCTEHVQPVRHVWEPISVAQPASRDQPGLLQQTCSVCGGVRTETSSNIALGKPTTRGDQFLLKPFPKPTNGSATESLSTRKEAIPHASPTITDDSLCFVQVDLEGLYSIDSATLVTYLEPFRDHFALYACDDPTKPIAQWQRIASKRSPTESTPEGVTFQFETPHTAAAIRVYGIAENLLLTELSLSGTYLGPAPKPQHTWLSSLQSNPDFHWLECADEGCGARRLRQAHTFGPQLLNRLPSGSTPGRYTRTCSICAYVEETPIAADPEVGTLLSADNPATLADGSSAPWVTDRDLQAGKWIGKPASENLDSNECFVQIDLGEPHPIQQVNVIEAVSEEIQTRVLILGANDASLPPSQWTSLGEFSPAAKLTQEGRTLQTSGAPYRFLRIYCTSTTGPSWAIANGFHIREVSVWGK